MINISKLLDNISDIDAFADFIEADTNEKLSADARRIFPEFRLDRIKMKMAYINGILNAIMFSEEQQGRELTQEELLEVELALKEKMGVPFNNA